MVALKEGKIRMEHGRTDDNSKTLIVLPDFLNYVLGLP